MHDMVGVRCPVAGVNPMNSSVAGITTGFGRKSAQPFSRISGGPAVRMGPFYGFILERVTMTKRCLALSLLIAGVTSVTVAAQVAAPSKEHEVLKMEVGDWDCRMKLWMGPEGPYDEPQMSEGSESNRMLGDFWVVSNFQGDFGGMPFTGHGQFGYDTIANQYAGTWIDSFGPHLMTMTGSYDAETKTMTWESTSVGMDGNPSRGKNVVVYEGKDRRRMTMYMEMPGQSEMVKVMEISYTRKTTEE
jgi:hypothetical protein